MDQQRRRGRTPMSLAVLIGIMTMLPGSVAAADTLESRAKAGWWQTSGAEARATFAPVLAGASDDRSQSVFSVPVSERVSFGFGYEYVTPEDLAFELAESGALASDYESHQVMIRARWRF